MADQQKYLEAKQRICRTLTKIIADSEDLIADIEWWNANRTDCEPIDVGGQKVQLAKARALLALVEADRPIPDGLSEQLLEQSLRLCEE